MRNVRNARIECNMKKLIIKILCIAVPVLLFVGGVNACVDPAAIFVRAREIAVVVELLREGNYVVSDMNMNERHLQKQRIQSEEALPDIVVIGSSRVMTMDSDFVQQHIGEGKFVNHGVSGGGLYDYFGILGCYELYQGELPETVIIGADPWIFNGLNVEEHRYDYYQNEIDYMYALVAERENTWWQKSRVMVKKAWDFVGQLFSPAYFQYALNWWQDSESPKESSYRVVEGEDATEDGLRRPDGSIRYPFVTIYRDPAATERDVESALANGWIPQMKDYGKMDTKMQEEFTLLVDFLQEQDVKVILYLAPFHPAFYEYFQTDEDYQAVTMTEEWLLEYAESRDIQVYGSYDPAFQSLSSTDFHDGVHLRNQTEVETWKLNRK